MIYPDEITMKDLCYLHSRDPKSTPRLTCNDISKKSSAEITWTDLQTLLRQNNEYHDDLYTAGILNDEQYIFLKKTNNYTEQEKRNAWGIAYPSIYHLVWYQQSDQYIYRGQYDAKWSLETSLLRPEGDKALTVEKLLERVQRTEAFLKALKQNQRNLFGKNLDDKSLLAIAQHFGFPTNLLDYSRSLSVAAFFATSKACKLKDEDSPVIGVIYRMRSTQQEELAENVTQPFKIPLLELTGINIGKLEIIEPDIPDEDNRIRRQQGVFVSGYNPRDLQKISIDVIYFQQIPGEVYEDTYNGLDETTFFPHETPIDKLKKEVEDAFKDPILPISSVLGETRLTGYSVIGSNGDNLYTLLIGSKNFFSALYEFIHKANLGSEFTHIEAILREYFQYINIEASISGTVAKRDEQAHQDPIFIATEKLAQWANLDFEKFRKNYIEPILKGKTRDFSSKNKRKQIAWSCILYMIGWEYLRFVDGDRADDFISKAWMTVY